MTEKEFFEKNLELSTEFSKYLLAHPELESQIPRDAQMVFLVDNDPGLTQKNLELAKKHRQEGVPVVFVRIKGLRPETSRLIDPRLEETVRF